MAAAKLKSSSVDRTRHVVLVQVDDTDEIQVVTAGRDDAEALARAVVDAAASLSTIVLPIGEVGSRGHTVIGHIVLDLAKARRTTVRVESQTLHAASMGIKK
jgi:hypothetical protein